MLIYSRALSLQRREKSLRPLFQLTTILQRLHLTAKEWAELEKLSLLVYSIFFFGCCCCSINSYLWGHWPSKVIIMWCLSNSRDVWHCFLYFRDKWRCLYMQPSLKISSGFFYCPYLGHKDATKRLRSCLFGIQVSLSLIFMPQLAFKCSASPLISIIKFKT